MNVQRAEQIATSPTMAHVTYDGEPIYIQRVHAEKETAHIFPLDRPNEEQEVPLSMLQEHT